MLYLKEGDLYKNVRMLEGEIESLFYGDVYILIKGRKEDTWTLAAYDEENDKVRYGYNYISNVESDDMLRFINDDTILEYYKSSNSNFIKPKNCNPIKSTEEELDVCVGDFVTRKRGNSGVIEGIYKTPSGDIVYLLRMTSNDLCIMLKSEIKEVYKKIN